MSMYLTPSSRLTTDTCTGSPTSTGEVHSTGIDSQVIARKLDGANIGTASVVIGNSSNVTQSNPISLDEEPRDEANLSTSHESGELQDLSTGGLELQGRGSKRPLEVTTPERDFKLRRIDSEDEDDSARRDHNLNKSELRFKLPSGKLSKPIDKMSDHDLRSMASIISANSKSDSELRNFVSVVKNFAPDLDLSETKIEEHEHQITTEALVKIEKDLSSFRVRTIDNLSDGESESEDPNIGWRSLRSDEASAKIDGLKPPVGHDKNITAAKHISAGTRAKVKSEFISLSHSLSVAAPWSVSKGAAKLIAEVRLDMIRDDAQKRNTDDGYIDTTDESMQDYLSNNGLGATALNNSKSSQEILNRGGIDSKAIINIYKSERITVKEYNELKNDENFDGKIIRARSEVKSKPVPIKLTRL